MKLPRLYLFLLVSTLSSSAIAEEPDEHWVSAIKRLFGTWESTDTRGFDDDTKVQIKFCHDGSICTKFTMGGIEDENKGIYTVGKSHIYFWADGPPAGVEVEDPEEHHQAMLMTYQLEGDRLKLTILDGKDRFFVTLKKRKREQAEDNQDAAHRRARTVLPVSTINSRSGVRPLLRLASP